MNVHCINIVHVDGLFINMSEEKSKSKKRESAENYQSGNKRSNRIHDSYFIW